MSPVTYSITAHDGAPPSPAAQVVPTPERSGAAFLPTLDSPLPQPQQQQERRRREQRRAGADAAGAVETPSRDPAGADANVSAAQMRVGTEGAEEEHAKNNDGQSPRRRGSVRRSPARGGRSQGQQPLPEALASVRIFFLLFFFRTFFSTHKNRIARLSTRTIASILNDSHSCSKTRLPFYYCYYFIYLGDPTRRSRRVCIVPPPLPAIPSWTKTMVNFRWRGAPSPPRPAISFQVRAPRGFLD